MKQVFSVRDGKAQFYGPIFLKDKEAEAIRDFQVAVNNTNSGLLYQFSEDFDLYHLGSYDQLTGKLISFDSPKHLIKGVNLKEVQVPGPVLNQ